MRILKRVLLAAMVMVSGAAAHAQTTPYYLLDGDSGNTVVIQNGAVINSFASPYLGYPVAINSTIWIGDRDDHGATEYTLAGTPTGHTSAGGGNFSQLLDGATDGTSNYGATYGIQYVTKAAADWSHQTALFALTDSASGIAYDSHSSTLWVTLYNGQLNQYSLSGQLLSSYNESGTLAALAYERSTDTLWAWDRNGSSLKQISTADGSVMQSTFVSAASYGVSNPYGGEMQISAVPEPSAALLLLGGLSLLGWLVRRQRISGSCG